MTYAKVKPSKKGGDFGVAGMLLLFRHGFGCEDYSDSTQSSSFISSLSTVISFWCRAREGGGGMRAKSNKKIGGINSKKVWTRASRYRGEGDMQMRSR